MFEQLCQHTIIQLPVAHLLTQQLHNRSHTFVTRDCAGITWHARKLKDSQQNFYSGAHHWNLCQTSAYLLWELVTVNTALLSQTDRGCGGDGGWKSEKVPRYICTAPAEAPSSNVSLPRTAPRTRRRTRVSRAWHLLQWMRRYKTTKWRLLMGQMREMWRLWRHVAGLHRTSRRWHLSTLYMLQRMRRWNPT